MLKRLIAVVVVSLLVGAACSSSATDRVTTTPGDAPESPSPDVAAVPSDAGPAPAGTDIPAVDVIDVRTGQTVNLQSFASGDKPILFWFWAPH